MTAEVPEISVEAFASDVTTGRLIDIRERDEFDSGHVRDAVNVPLHELDGAIPSLRAEQPIFVICRSGNRSRRGAATLRAAGIDAVSVAGGTAEWEASGRELL